VLFRSEPAEATHHAAPAGGMRQRLDRFDKSVARVDVDPGIAVA
jgi:hypothetical protein